MPAQNEQFATSLYMKCSTSAARIFAAAGGEPCFLVRSILGLAMPFGVMLRFSG